MLRGNAHQLTGTSGLLSRVCLPGWYPDTTTPNWTFADETQPESGAGYLPEKVDNPI